MNWRAESIQMQDQWVNSEIRTTQGTEESDF